MNKKDFITGILREANIHHNIRINFNAVPANLGEDWNYIAEDCINMFCEDWQMKPENDCGNRNLCKCVKVICKKEDFKIDNGDNGKTYSDEIGRWFDYKEAKKNGWIDKRSRNFTENGACIKHDLWHIYTHGRMGATLYWDKYWNESNTRGIFFKYDEEELNEMDGMELKKIHKEIKMFKEAVRDLMSSFYTECEYRNAEKIKEKNEEDIKEKAKQQAIKIIKKYGLLKEIISELM